MSRFYAIAILLISFTQSAFSSGIVYYKDLKLGYKDNAIKLTNSRFHSSLSGYVTLSFDHQEGEISSYNDFQLVKAILKNNNPIDFSFHKPDSSRLNPMYWGRLLSSQNQFMASLPVVGASKSPSHYELWGSLVESNYRGEPDFLGYVEVQKCPSSFADFIGSNHFFNAEIDTFKTELKAQIEQGAYWTQHIEIAIGKDKHQHYTIDSLLGAGVDGYVIKAVPKDPANPLAAIKFFVGMPKTINDNINNEIEFRKILRDFSNNVGGLLSDDEQNISEMQALTMEYIDGPTLGQFLESKPSLSLDETRSILETIFEICSRIRLYDITRENIMLVPSTEGYIVKFIDFAKCGDGSTFCENKGRGKTKFFKLLIDDLAALLPYQDQETLKSDFYERLEKLSKNAKK